jgi:hypothetical protein
MNTDRPYRRAFFFFASAPLVGLAMILAAFFAGRRVDPLLGFGFWLTLIFALVSFVFIGIAAAVASNRSTVIGSSTWFGGFAAVLALSVIAVRNYQEWDPGRVLLLEFTACAAMPASVVGSLIGLGIGFAISSTQRTPTVDGKADK